MKLKYTTHKPVLGMGSLWILDRPMSWDTLFNLIEELFQVYPDLPDITEFDSDENYDAESLEYILNDLLPPTSAKLFDVALPSNYPTYGWVDIDHTTFEPGEFNGLRFATNYKRRPIREVLDRYEGKI